MTRILCVYGTRPEIIKMVSVVRALRSLQGVECRVLNTGQHRELVAELESTLELAPDFRFDIMRKNQSLNEIVQHVLGAFSDLMRTYRPDVVVLQGDTSTVLSMGIACFHENIGIAHVEAGLRSFDLHSPFPEEFNRRTLSMVANYNFAPTERAAENLRREGIPESKVWVTGNTVIDAIRLMEARGAIGTENSPGNRQILVTAHRRESFGGGIQRVCEAARQILEEYDDVSLIWPVHPNPNVREIVCRELAGCERATLCQPMDYLTLLRTMRGAHHIWTDSGGIQEEAPCFRKPILILRDVTERPEVVEAGFGRLVGTSVEHILRESRRLLKDQREYQHRTGGENPFGDGSAGQRIAKILAEQSR